MQSTPRNWQAIVIFIQVKDEYAFKLYCLTSSLSVISKVGQTCATDQRNMSDTFTCRGPPVSWAGGAESRPEHAPHLWSSHRKMTKTVNLIYEQQCSPSMFSAWFSRPVISKHTCQGWKVQGGALECIYTDTPHTIKLFISFPRKKIVCQNRDAFKAALTDMFVLTITKHLQISARGGFAMMTFLQNPSALHFQHHF